MNEKSAPPIPTAPASFGGPYQGGQQGGYQPDPYGHPPSATAPGISEAASQPFVTAGDDTSFVITVSDGNTVKVGFIDAIYTQEIPGMSYMKPTNGGFLAINVSWETLTGTSLASSSNFEAYDADGNEGEGIYLEDGLEGLPTEEVAAGDGRQGVVVFDVKKGPTTIVVTDDVGDKAATFTLACDCWR